MAMRMSGRGASQVASKARKLSNFGKCWEVGDKGIVFYPIFWDEENGRAELLVSAAWGYRVNSMDALGLKATFIPSNADINDDGVPVEPDITAQFSKLAPAFVAGEKAAAEAKLYAKDWPTTQAQRTALESLEKMYDTKNNPDAKRPVISKLCYLITTECIYVPLKDEKPDWDNARLVAQSLSTTKLNKLCTILDEPMYGINKDSPYLEVQYNFTAADGKKSTAGKNDPIGLAEGQTLESRFPDDIGKLKEFTAQLPTDSETIKNHNYSFMHIPEATLRSTFQAYCITYSDNLDAVPEDFKESVVKQAAFIDEIALTKSLKNAELIQAVQEKLAELAANAPTHLNTNDPVPHAGMDPVPTAPAMPSKAPTISELMAGTNLASDDLADTEL